MLVLQWCLSKGFLNNIYPIPNDLKNTTSGSFQSIGYDAQFGDYEKILSYEWIPNQLKTREELVEHLRGVSTEYITEGQKYKDNIEKYGCKSWYDWCVQEWGTKWDVDATEGNRTDNEIVYFFDSAWSPPTTWLQKASELYPDLKFHLEYEEGGCCFAGDAYAENGDLEDIDKPYMSCCECCDERGEDVEYREGVEMCCCDECYEEEKKDLGWTSKYIPGAGELGWKDR